MRTFLIVSFMVLISILVCSCGSGSSSNPTASPSIVPTLSPTLTPEEEVSTPNPEPSPTLGKPVAIIEDVTPNPAYVHDKVTFKGRAGNLSGPAKEYRWSFEGHGPIAFHDSFESSVVTENPGTYTITFEIRDWDGTWLPPATATLTVLSRPPTALFNCQPTSGNVPLTVSFTDLSTRNITSWLWDFGDGETSDVQNPIHTYTSAGNYTISLTVEGPDGSDTEVKESLIEVIGVDFSASLTSGYRPLKVQFTDLSKGDINSWAWHFGDGSTSEEQNPSHTYEDAGSYQVTLIVSSESGAIGTKTKTNYIRVLEAPPVANFFCHTSTYVDFKEQFKNLSTGNITSWLWNFGDGSTSSDQDPSHTYSVAGTYTVSLTVTGPGGSDTQQRTITVSEW